MAVGEISGLQWEYVNFIERWIYVQHSFSRYGGLKGPKRPARHRFIPLSSEMNTWLGRLAERHGHPTTGHVFNADPKYLTGESQHCLRSRTEGLKAAQIRLGFVNENGKARWSMHEMRHYAGSVWLELGHPLESVSRMLGHEKTDTTKRYYIHYFKKQALDRDRAILAKMSELHRLPAMRNVRDS